MWIIRQVVWLLVLCFIAITAAEAEPCNQLLDLPTRGIACLHCNQPEARTQANALSDMLVDTCLKRVAMNYIVDGSFDYDPAFMQSQIDKLTAGGRELYLEFYLYNGPWARRYPRSPGPGFATDVSPAAFRWLILYDENLRNEYRSTVDRVIPILGYAGSLGARLHVSWLEDNFDQLSFQEMFNLTGERIPPWLPVSYGRNPCPGCYRGNTSYIPPGFFREEHADKPNKRFVWGIVTNDGDGHSNPDKLRSTMLTAGRQHNIFILWTQSYQGIGASNTLGDPAKRHYKIPTAKERAAIITLLRRTE